MERLLHGPVKGCCENPKRLAGRGLQLLVPEGAGTERPTSARPGGAGKFMVCIHFLAPEPRAPESQGPGRSMP